MTTEFDRWAMNDLALVEDRQETGGERFEDGGAPQIADADESVPSADEERVWLAQMQEPDRVMKAARAVHLTGAIDSLRLVEAASALFRAEPKLGARYHFEDIGLVRRFHAEPAEGAVEILRADAIDEACGLICERQNRAFDAEREPALAVLVILLPDAVVVGALLHRIAFETASVDTVLANIARIMDGRAPTWPEARAGLDLAAPLERPAPIAGIRTPCPAPLIRSGEGELDPRPRAQVFQTTLDESALGAARDPVAVFSVTAAAFARLVLDLGGREAIDLRLPAGLQSEDAADPKTVGVVIEQGHSQAEIADKVSAVLSGRAGETRRDDGAIRPLVAVAHRPSASDCFTVKGITARRLSLPHPDDPGELRLSIGFDADRPGAIDIELATDPLVSRFAGGFLIERLVDRLIGQEATGLSLEWAGAPPSAEEAPKIAASPLAERPTFLSSTSIESLILAEFREALGAASMGPDDDFFDFGGHSLIATRIIGRLQGEHGIELRFNDLFSHPTAAGLARQATVMVVAEPETASQPRPSTMAAPLSLAQASLWKAYAAFGFGEIFNLPFALDFLQPVDERVFERAFLDILERHTGLRTLFRSEGEEVRQHVVPMAELSHYRWFWTSEDSAGIDRHDEAGHHFDLSRELPLRLRFLRDPGTGRQTLSFLFHHIVLDEWSVNLMMDELTIAYRARAEGRAPHFATTPRPFHEFAEAQAAAGIDERDVRYWTDRLNDAPQGPPLARLNTAEDQTGDSSPAGGWVEIKPSQTVCEGLYAVSKENSASLFNTVYAAIAAALAKLGDLDDLVIGTSASGRTDHSFFDTVGYFTTVVAHRLHFDADLTIGALIEQAKLTVNESMPHTHIPIDIVEEALGMAPGRDHLFGVFIQIHAKNKLNGALRAADGGEIEFRQVDPERHESLLGLQFEVMEETIGGRRSIRVLMSYRADQYGPDLVEAVSRTTGEMFERFAGPDASGVRLQDS
ncbi:Phosphopantetheine attachment site [Fulvimarina manganoxydans]|uniref:Phosphopantetheine attachment site n=1 Tax=Fulvimarina manganoxydans TaxID=937218 RepID=A0A1W2AQY6_9HYPH|nr:condensation domain-containing protein [Fulvimarina manganoxydans]SMC63159.1 Phosphopantetheine attachment site [Fulvimarina manganoxydans]